MKIRTDQPLMDDGLKITQMMADFWDKTSDAWRMIWGPHIHHGYFEDNHLLTPLEAQENLIEKLLQYVIIKSETAILDVGCGMGGSSIYLAKKYQATVTGITLSPKQIEIATRYSQTEKVKNVKFEIDDALSLSKFQNNSFDIVWSLESCEQFYNKNLFIKQAHRVLKPGGQLMLATCCSDREQYEGTLAIQYRKLCKIFDLPYMPTIESYQASLELAQFQLTQVLDWSLHVKQTWDVGISLLSSSSFLTLFRMIGWRALNATKQAKLMQNAFNQENVKYGVFIAIK